MLLVDCQYPEICLFSKDFFWIYCLNSARLLSSFFGFELLLFPVCAMLQHLHDHFGYFFGSLWMFFMLTKFQLYDIANLFHIWLPWYCCDWIWRTAHCYSFVLIKRCLSNQIGELLEDHYCVSRELLLWAQSDPFAG